MGDLEVYQADFEAQFLEDTSAFYAREAQRWVQEDGLPDYLVKVPPLPPRGKGHRRGEVEGERSYRRILEQRRTGRSSPARSSVVCDLGYNSRCTGRESPEIRNGASNELP